MGEHRGIHSPDRLIGIFSFEGKAGQVETGLEDGVYVNLVDGQEICVRDGKADLAACPAIIAV